MAASLHLGGVFRKKKEEEEEKEEKKNPTKGAHSDDVSGTLESRTTPTDLVPQEKTFFLFEAPPSARPSPHPQKKVEERGFKNGCPLPLRTSALFVGILISSS